MLYQKQFCRLHDPRGFMECTRFPTFNLRILSKYCTNFHLFLKKKNIQAVGINNSDNWNKCIT